MGTFHDFIGRFVPPSSRSFHSLYSEVLSLREDVRTLSGEIWKLREQNMDLQKRCSELNDFGHLCREDLHVHDTHVKMMLWGAMHDEGETLEETKKAFFSLMATKSENLRLLQRGNSKLLSDFAGLCKQLDIEYWLMFGTLLGAVRHGGFIPWDDDLDVGMMRDDIQKLAHAVKDDDRYRISSVYDYYAHCWQIRFMYSDEDNPCFIDLFIFDYSKDVDSASFKKVLSLRGDMIDEMNSNPSLSAWADTPYLNTEGDGLLVTEIGETFNRYRNEAMRIGIGGVSDKESNGLTFGIDNYFDSSDGVLSYRTNDVFPIKRLSFEGAEVNVPQNYKTVLANCYGDIYELPRDIHSHYEHVSKESLADGKIKAAILRQLGE